MELPGSTFHCNGNYRNNCAQPYSLVAEQLQTANELFRQIWFRGNIYRLWSKVTGRGAQLKNLSTDGFKARSINSHSLGIRSVPLDQIHGSENRSGDFDAKFYPTRYEDRQRWVNIAKLRLLHVDLQAVSLIQVGEVYFVRDGHHRISVARALGEKYIDADVVQWQHQPDRLADFQLPELKGSILLEKECVC